MFIASCWYTTTKSQCQP